jgi:hypothetical protein
MARPETVVNEVRDAAVDFLRALDKFEPVRRKYFALGGDTFISPYFFQEDGTTPRTDLDIDAEGVTGIINSLDAVQTLMGEGHRTNLSRGTR